MARPRAWAEWLRGRLAWREGREGDFNFWALALAVAVAWAGLTLSDAYGLLAQSASVDPAAFGLSVVVAAIFLGLVIAIPRSGLRAMAAFRHVLILGVMALLLVWGRAPESQPYLYATGLLVIALAAFLTSPWFVLAYGTAAVVAIAILTWPIGLGPLNLGTVAVMGLGATVASFLFAQSRRLARQQAATLERRVAERTQQLRDFTAAVSHELRTPLSNIRAYAETELEAGDALSPESRESLQIIVDEVEVLAEHVNNLLMAAQIDADALRPHLEPLCVDELVAEAVARVRGRFQLLQRRLVVAVPVGLPPISADARFARTILVNLLDNAHKYSAPSEPIELGAASVDGGVVVRVTDHGVGIPVDEQARVFDRYWRGALGGRRGGLGLGLSICRGLARSQGGDVSFVSVVGQGSTFLLRLPCAKDGD